jgi:hypothetical protein
VLTWRATCSLSLEACFHSASMTCGRARAEAGTSRDDDGEPGAGRGIGGTRVRPSANACVSPPIRSPTSSGAFAVVGVFPHGTFSQPSQAAWMSEPRRLAGGGIMNGSDWLGGPARRLAEEGR